MKKKITVVAIIWIVVLVVGGVYFHMKKESEKINVINIAKKENPLIDEKKEENVTLYSVNEQRSELVTEKQTIPSYSNERDKIEKLVQLSCEKLWKAKLLSTPQIEINNIFIDGDMLYLDLDANILEMKGENRGNLLGIYSIVNSITEIGSIKRVKILVDGKEETGIFSNTYTRNTGI